MVPGEIIAGAGEINLNADRPVITLTVANTGDRPIQVGSHYHFAETNAALHFDRVAARGHRLDIPAGTAVRFEPGRPAMCSSSPIPAPEWCTDLIRLSWGSFDSTSRTIALGVVEPAFTAKNFRPISEDAYRHLERDARTDAQRSCCA